MEMWISKEKCTGCGVCSNICPQKAIKMLEDDTGFVYPVIDKEKCVDCGFCKKTCPVFENKNNNNYREPIVFASWSKNESVRYTSTSGGLFTELAKQFIINNGYVVGAAYNKDNMVEHKMVNDLLGLEELKQSKYLQSDSKEVYKETKEILEEGKSVAFCGAPCQIAGLNKFLAKEYNNLLTIEFICRGMNSPKAYRSWLSQIENEECKKINKVWFKYKENGWKKSPKCTKIDFEDGTSKIFNGEKNLYMVGYLGPNLYIRSSCGDCKFNTLPRQADITLADFWGIQKELDDDKGTSLILINSNKGKEYFENIKDNIFFEERNIQEIYDGNVCFNNSVKINKNSIKFLKELNDNNFDKLLKKYDDTNYIYKKILRKCKRLLKRILKRNS